MTTQARPLDGIRILELGQLIAGPFAGSILGYFGADVIKVEPPGGDPIRTWRSMEGDTSLWWRQIARNKRSIAIDLRDPDGQSLARTLALESDVLIENFRPGTLEGWNLAPGDLRRDHPGLVVARVSGYGQDGPKARDPGFASVCEAYAGLRYVTGTPGAPSVRANLSLGDSLAGLHAALGILLALRHRDATGVGQDIDVSLVESILNVTESMIPEADRLGLDRQPSGPSITGVVPTGTFDCQDGIPIVLGANSEPIFGRLVRAMGRPELATDPRFSNNEARVANRDALEAEINAWTRSKSSSAVARALEEAEVPCSRIHRATDLLDDPQLEARAALESIDVGGRSLRVARVAPRLSASPGRTTSSGPELGAHTSEIARGAGLSDDEIARLRESGVLR